MSVNRLFYTVKLTSALIKEFKFNLELSFQQCIEENLVISLSDSQMLKSIRDITGQKIDRNQLEIWYEERDRLKRSKNVTQYKKTRIKELQNNIYNMMYIPQYITVVMDSVNDYERLYKKGFVFNGKIYKRGSCSASQARVSTIVFVDQDIKEELSKRLNCGRDLNHPMAPSKFNAYYGLYSSATKPVTKPRFCIVPDISVPMTHTVDYVIELGKDEDDIIEEREVTSDENRFDGSGLISPQMAVQWGIDLGETYTPCNFCLRYTFTKGMVNTFDFVKWCEVYNDNNYVIKDIWGKDIDLREIDVILSEGQVKMWDSWPDQETFERLSDENGIQFRITKYSPEKDKKVLTANYQYLQTLDLNDDDIKELCADTIKYIKGVSYDDVYYTLLFCLGQGMDEDHLKKYLVSSDNYWLNSLILNHDILKDKYSRDKIRDMIVTKIEQACLGRIIVKGNYTCICPDPFAYMEWICYRDINKVNGLLKAGEAYCHFWNENGNPKQVDAMRSPLTHFSEHGIDNIVTNEEMEEWYKYCYSGYINNIHDEFTYIHAGSDWDYDIISSTDSPQFIKGKYPNQKVVTYNVKKPKKRSGITEDDLFVTDTFSFGNAIGQITNTCSSICARLVEFPKDSKQYKILSDRLKAGCAAQSRQIDKTKIGEEVKTMSTLCRQFQHVDHEKDSPEEIEKKMFYNTLLVDRKPYFFKYKYNSLAKEIRDYDYRNNENAIRIFSVTLKDLLNMRKNNQELTEAQTNFLYYYDRYYPAINTDCVMNKICKYIENTDFQIKQKIRTDGDFDYKQLLTKDFKISNKLYEEIKILVTDTMKSWKRQCAENNKKTVVEKSIKDDIAQAKFEKDTAYRILKEQLMDLCKNEEELANYLIVLFYKDKPAYNRGVLWNLAGKQIYENILQNTNSFFFPIKDKNGSMEFLYEKYQITKINLNRDEIKLNEDLV